VYTNDKVHEKHRTLLKNRRRLEGITHKRPDESIVTVSAQILPQLLVTGI